VIAILGLPTKHSHMARAVCDTVLALDPALNGGIVIRRASLNLISSFLHRHCK